MNWINNLDLKQILIAIAVFAIVFFIIKKLRNFFSHKTHYRKSSRSTKSTNKKYEGKKYHKPEDPLGLKREEEVEVGKVEIIGDKKKKKERKFVYNHNYLNGIDKEIIYLDEIQQENTKIVGFTKNPIKGFFTNLIWKQRAGFFSKLADLIKGNPNKGYFELVTEAQNQARVDIARNAGDNDQAGGRGY